MNVWAYLDRRHARLVELDRHMSEKAGLSERLLPKDFRGWLGLGLFLQSTFLFLLIATVPDLRESQGFLTLASAVIVSGWIGGAAAFAYAAGKSNADRSEQVSAALRLAEQNNRDGEPKADVVLRPGETAQAETDNARATRTED